MMSTITVNSMLLSSTIVIVNSLSSIDCSSVNSTANVCKYIFVNMYETWENANNHCLSQYGSYLATITNNYDMAIAQNILLQNDAYDVWIGLTDKFNEGEWQWIDGTSCYYTSTRLCIDDQHWASNEPNDDGGQDCCQLLTSGEFDDHCFVRKNIYVQ